MKKYETRKRTGTYQVLVHRECDLCGFKTTSDDWDGGVYKVNETEIQVTVKQKEGNNYPDCGFGTEFDIDLCPNCFKDKLVPWLRSEGADIRETDWDW